ncbi:methyltransferase domain-containing protein [Synechococcus sp. RSCCF101]|uniref:methyltransferase domain-containing protein n=1 Tax=Synechococcus sp. RSCCF101 TaxID=2511069 RepID=UPI0012451D88|nr:methyltransferase domain-containing protein [Synechococcus sp. RSCCF101]QEY31247.1 methyltransferase domain-containing protein [Synechococcus sp. RSCCF101]
MRPGKALNQRDRRPEVMDQPGLDPREHERALAGLRRINAVSRCSAGLLEPIAQLARNHPDAPLSVLELACGGGDTAIDLAQMAERRGIDLRIRACDINPEAIRIATANARRRGVELDLFVADALEPPTDATADVVLCTLFAHHLDGPDVIRLLLGMAARARRLVLVDDLIRSRLGYALAWMGTRLLSRSWVVHTDGPLSVRAAFTASEILELAHQAGLSSVRLQRTWPERYLLSWSPD